MRDVKILFPGRERLRRTRRGFRPNRVVVAPSFYELVATAHKDKEVLMSHEQEDSGIRTYFFLLKCEGLYGYLRVRELVNQPITKDCASYGALQNIYDDVRRNVVWKATLKILVDTVRHSRKISGHNIFFTDKIKEQFKDDFPEAAVPIVNDAAPKDQY